MNVKSNKFFSIRFFQFVFAFFLTGAVFGQEVCDNGIDDDGDGFVDCYDTDCGVGSGCEDFFVHPNPSCQVPPNVVNFDMRLQWESAINTAADNSAVTVGDLDSDGIPEIIAVNYYGYSISILDGETGAVEKTSNIHYDFWNGVGPPKGVAPNNESFFADVDGDGNAELFFPVLVTNGVAAYDNQLNPLWLAEIGIMPGNPGIADFDEDGIPEIYARDVIIDALTGTVMNSSSYVKTKTDTLTACEYNLNMSGVAVDILPDAACANCAGLELVNGGKIYSVSINRGTMTASLNLEKTIPTFPIYMKGAWGYNRTGTSVADYNQDGFLDVVFAGVDYATDTITKYFFWDVQNNVISRYLDPTYNWQYGAGRPNIADMDGDGTPDATFVSGQYLYILDENWTLLKRYPIQETTSGNTGTTVFDFNGDGIFEIVYRDEAFLQIFDVTAPGNAAVKAIPAKSLTWTEYPVVADVDGDGDTEIVVTCLHDSYSVINTGNDKHGVVRVFEAAGGEHWVPSRQIWNQHGYFNVNINDDMTVPTELQAHHLVFSSGVCGVGPVRPLNTFLNQAPYMTNEGCRDWAAPDFSFDGNVVVSPPTCPNTDFTVSFDMSNIGDRVVRGLVPITFYDGDPTVAGSTKLNTVLQYVNLPPGTSMTVSNVMVKGTGSSFTLSISINDEGLQNPPVVPPLSNLLECQTNNNTGTVPINPLTVPIVAVKLDDDNRCSPVIDTLANGAAMAYVNETKLFWNENFEDLAPTSISDGGSTSWSRTMTIDTTGYAEVKLNGSNKEFEVNYSSGEVVWTSGVINISTYDSVSLSAYVRSESREGDFFDNDDYLRIYYKLNGGAEIPMPGGNFTGAVAAGIPGSGSDATTVSLDTIKGTNLQIIVKFDNDTSEYYFLDNVVVTGRGDFTAGYTFNWFEAVVDGTPENIGPNYNNMNDTIFYVYATNNATGCYSDTAAVTILRTEDSPIIDIIIISNQTNCKTPDGSMIASAQVYGGEPQSDFIFEWYEGLDVFTSPVIAIGQTVSALGADTYTVLVTDKKSGCADLKSKNIDSDINIPVVNATVNMHNTSCIAGNGEASVQVTGTGVIWFEDFEDNVVGQQVDVGLSAWTRSGTTTASGMHAEVRDVLGSHVFEVYKNGSFNTTYWNAETIDITGLTNVRFSMQVSSEGLPSSFLPTFLEVEYRIDGGSWQSAEKFFTDVDAPQPQIVEVNGLSGSSLEIRVVFFQVTNSDWYYRIDNIIVEGDGTFTDNYDFKWYDGNSVKPTEDYLGDTIKNLSAGDYTVIAISKFTECASSPATVTIKDTLTSFVPSIKIINPNTSCDPTNPNGMLSGNVAGDSVSYDFFWYAGQQTTVLLSGPAQNVSGLSAGIYTVKAVNASTGCDSTAEATIVDTPPTIGANLTLTPSTYCAGGNGALDANGTGGVGPYIYLWYDGSVGAPDPLAPDHTGAPIANMAAGNYTLLVKDNFLCISNAIPAVIADNSVAPNVAGTTTDQTSCDATNPNGALSANVGGVTAGYTFNIFTGASTLPANEVAGSPASSVSGLASSIYTILATNNTTGCTNTVQVTVNETLTYPTVTASTTANQTICTGGSEDGIVTANVGGVTAGYTFYWFDGNIAAPDTTIADYTGITYSGLASSDYTVVALDKTTSCASARQVTAVTDATVAPPITTSTTDDTACDTNVANGTVSANVGGLTAGYTFEWFDGANITDPTLGMGASKIGLDAGTYTVRVISVATGCVNTAQQDVQNNPTAPVVTAVLVQDQSNCSVGLINGEVSANVGGVTAGYTFYWFDGNEGAPDTTNVDHTGINYTGLVADDYTVIVKENATRCLSVRDVATVGNSIVKPVITTAGVNNTSCDAANPNGQVSANVGGVTAGYTFEWFDGAGTVPPNIGTNPSVTDLAANTYTVLVIENATGCDTTKSLSILDAPVPPVVTANTDQNQTTCSAPLLNGQVSANVGGVTAGYTFYWFDGNIAVPDTTLADHIGVTYGSLLAGDYTVVAKDNTLKCVSTVAQVTSVGDAIVYPNTTASKVDNTSCDAGNPNGQLSANVGGSIEPAYTFEWFDGQTTAPAASIGNTSGINGWDAGTYTVLVYEVATGCPDTTEITMSDNLTYPVVTGTVTADQSVCTVAALNGAVSAAVGGVTAGYNFFWFDGDIAAPDTTASDYVGAAYNTLAAGKYTVVAVDASTLCPSVRDMVEVQNSVILPNIAITGTNNSSCDPANPIGTLGASVLPGNVIEPTYTFDWFDAANTLPANFMATGSSQNGVKGGTYTVLVTNTISGCDSTTQVTIADVVPTIFTNPTTVDNTNCAPFNGVLNAAAVGGAGGYVFNWYDGAVGVPDVNNPDFTGSNVTSKAPGIYTLLVQDQYLCLSAPVVDTIDDNPVLPVVSAMKTDRTACDATLTNGSASADVGGVTAGYNWEWFNGNNTNAANLIANTPGVSNLLDNIYTVKAFNPANGCSDTTTVTVANASVQPIITTLDSTDVTDCSVPDGTITVHMSAPNENTEYLYELYIGTTTLGPVLQTLNGTGNVFSGLDVGTYTVKAHHNTLGCDASNTLTISIGFDAASIVTVTENLVLKVTPGDCTTPMGTLVADAASGSGNAFDFEWYLGDKTSGMVFESNGNILIPVTRNELTNIAANRYTVIAIDQGTGCRDSLAMDLQYINAQAIDTISVTHQTRCDVANGAINTRFTSIPGGKTRADYRMVLYQGAAVINTINPATDPDPSIFNGLAAGNYTVVAIDNATNCVSNSIDVTINLIPSTPVIVGVTSKNTYCVAGNGTVKLTIDGGQPVVNYSYDWYDGPTSGDPVLPAAQVVVPGDSATALTAGQYTVVVTTVATGCVAQQSYAIADSIPVESITALDLNVTDQDACVPPNGANTVMQVHENGVAKPTADYTFTWYQTDRATELPGNVTGDTYSGLLAGTYYVKAMHSASSCTTDTTQFVIANLTASPFVVASNIDNNTNCGALVPNGSVTIDIDGGADPADYNIKWLESDGTSPLGTTTATATGVADSTEVNDLPAGTYIVNVTDDAGAGIGCVTQSIFNIIAAPPVITINDLDIRAKTNCIPANGSTMVLAVREDGVPMTSANYTYTWLEADGVTPLPGAVTDSVYTGLDAGTYNVMAFNTVSGCVSAPTMFTIIDSTSYPVVASTAINPNSNCMGINANGQIAIDVDGGANPADYDFQWFESDGTTPLTTIFSPDSTQATLLTHGNYVVEVVDVTGTNLNCATTKVYNVASDTALLAINTMTVTNKTNCFPQNGGANVVDLLEDAVPTVVGGGNYDFEWFDDALASISGANAPQNIASLDSGKYYVKGRNTLTNCYTDLKQFNIGQITTDPAIAINTLDPNTTCGVVNPDGQIVIDVDGGASPANYDFHWYESDGTTELGTVTATAVYSGDSTGVSSLPAGNYYVEVVDASGVNLNCGTTQIIAINSSSSTMSITDISIIDNTNCNPANGQSTVLEVTENAVANAVGGGNYDFEWFDAASVSVAGPNAPAVLSNLDSGTYFVQARNTTTNCSSPLTQFVVNLNTTNPVVGPVVINANSNCAGVNANGDITIQIDGGALPANYNFRWYESDGITPLGTTTLSAVINADSTNVSVLPAGTYKVDVIDVTGANLSCRGMATLMVNDNIDVISIDAPVVIDKTSCTVDNGDATVVSITENAVSVAVGGGNYDFEWMDAASATILGPNAINNLTTLDSGTYFVQARNTLTNCLTPVRQFAVALVTANPTIAINTLDPNTTCGVVNPDGQIIVDIDGGANPANYNFHWYESDGTTELGTVTASAVYSVDSTGVSSLPAGNYYVEIVDVFGVNLNCVSSQLVAVNSSSSVMSITDISIIDNTNCNPANGQSTVLEVTENAVANAVGGGNYDFEWFDAASVSISGPLAPAVLANLDSGTFFVQARNTTTNCSSPLTQFAVNLNTTNPVVGPVAIITNSNCAGVNANGDITIQIDGGALPANYNFRWYESDGVTPLGTTTLSAVINADSTNVSVLPAGTYKVDVIDVTGANLSCQGSATLIVNDNIDVISADGPVVTDKTNCIVNNGDATVVSITVNAVSVAVGGGNYDFEWLDAASVTILGPNAINNLATLDSGSYFVQARNTLTNCLTPVKQFAVNQVTSDPVVIASGITSNTTCGGVPDGLLVIDIDAGTDPADYTIAWFEADGVTPLGTITASAIVSANGDTVRQLPAGVFQVEVIANTAPGIGCAGMASFNVPNGLSTVTLADADIAVTDQEDCSPVNGAILVTSVLENLVPSDTANYDFDWYQADGVTPLPGGVNEPHYEDLPAGTYQMQATNIVTLCASALKQVVINDVTSDPIVIGTLTNNTNCGGIPNGLIVLDIDGGANPAEYNVSWFEADGTTPLGTTTATASISADGITVSLLPAGTYVVEVVDITNPGIGCSKTSSFTISGNLALVSVMAADLNIIDQEDCNPPNGSSTVVQVRANGIPGATGPYRFDWYEADGTTMLPGSVTAPSYGGLSGGSFFVQATDTATNCASGLTGFNILDITVNPIISLTASTQNTNCTGALPNGSISIDVDNGVPPITDYAISWFVVTGTVDPLLPNVPSAVISGDGDVVSQLPAGTYRVEVIDNTNPGLGCVSTSDFTIVDDQSNLQISALDLVITDQTNCLPINGSATVNAVRENGAPNANITDYTFEWFESDATTVMPGGITGPVYNTFGAGTYFVRATNDTTNCVSSVAQVDINDVTVNPFVSDQSIAPNTTCGVPAIPDGEVTIEIDGGAIPTDYIINWYESNGTDALGTTTTTALVNANGDVAGQLPAGVYRTEVIDNSGVNLNCAVTSTFTVADDIAILAIARPDMDLIDNTNCVGPNGTATVNFILEDSVQNGTANYSFSWMDSTKTVIATMGPTINTLAPATYYVVATNIVTNCTTSPEVQFEINDASILPVVRLESFVNPTRCDGVNNRGELTVSADNIMDNVQYNYQWFDGTNTSGLVVEPNNFFVSNLNQGDYTVLARNNTTGCETEENYTLIDDITDPLISASVTHLTSCIYEDGRMVATVINTSATYDYYWYDGNDTIPAALIYTGYDIDSVDIGTYTVLAIDRNDSFCRTRPATVDIYNRREWPEIEIFLDATLTYCDPTKANGQLSASVNGDFADYNFDWYAGTDTTAVPLYTGPVFGQLGAEIYTVRVVHRLTGCSRSDSLSIPDETIDPPAPTIEVVSEMYSCTLPNGVLRATVAGNTSDFDFDWWDGQTPSGSPVFTGSIYTQLDVGEYASIATDKETGCFSDPGHAVIKDTRVYPDYEVATENSLCVKPTGMAQIDMGPNFYYNDIVWDVDGQTINGPVVFEISAGEHEVTVYGKGDCPTTNTFFVGTDIHVFNGISPNGDGKNEVFHIGCIDFFQQNNVKIFNRAGQLVFEMDNYDNLAYAFDGEGNRGFYITTNQVPDGTYFYIIDKRDGSKPVSGYLELIR